MCGEEGFSLKFSSCTVPRVTVECTECSHNTDHDSHGMSIMLEALVKLDELLMDQGVPLELVFKGLLLLLCWQISM